MNYIQIPLSRGYIALIDEIDGDLAQYRWYATSGRCLYAGRNINKNGVHANVNMHRIVMERILGRTPCSQEFVDHIDRNGLNNCRTNLRLATPSQNLYNQKRRRDNTSGCKGIYWNKQNKKWDVRIHVNSERIYLGFYDDLNEAKEVYRQAALKYHGEFARVE